MAGHAGTHGREGGGALLAWAAIALAACGDGAVRVPAGTDGPGLVREVTPPHVLGLRWDTTGIPTGEDCPLADEHATVTCSARDEDGDAGTVTVTLVSLGPGTLSARHPATVTRSFPASPSATTREVTAEFVLVGSGARVQATCEIVDSHGLRDARAGTCGS